MPSLEDVRHVVALLRGDRVHLQQLAEAEDGVQGGAQLVTHPGQELALGLIRAIGFSRPHDGVLHLLALGDVLGRTFKVGCLAGRITHDPGAGQHPNDRPIQPAQPALEAADHAFPLQDADPLLPDLAVDIEILRVHRPQGLEVRASQDAQEGRVGLQDLPPDGGAVEAHGNAVKEAAIPFRAFATLLLASPARLFFALPIGHVDDDSVELSNLHRQLLHSSKDVGREKTASAAESIARLNPHVQVRTHQERLTNFTTAPSRAIWAVFWARSFGSK